MPSRWFRSTSKPRQVGEGMLLAVIAAAISQFLAEALFGGGHGPDPLGWLATLALSPLSVFRSLWWKVLSLFYLSWFFLPAGALSGLLIPRWTAAHSRSRAAALAAALGFGFSLAGLAVLLLLELVLLKDGPRTIRESVTGWLFWALFLSLGTYTSFWLVAWTLWRSPERETAPS